MTVRTSFANNRRSVSLRREENGRGRIIQSTHRNSVRCVTSFEKSVRFTLDVNS